LEEVRVADAFAQESTDRVKAWNWSLLVAAYVLVTAGLWHPGDATSGATIFFGALARGFGGLLPCMLPSVIIRRLRKQDGLPRNIDHGWTLLIAILQWLGLHYAATHRAMS
jgi:hypothetical protein